MGRVNITRKDPSKKKVVVHDVYILDASGSMGRHYNSNTKATKAIEGCVENIKTSLANKEVETKVTVCVFSKQVHFPIVAQATVGDVKAAIIDNWDSVMTSLNDAIGLTINTVWKNIEKGDKVSIKIFTDGGENGSTRYSSQDAAKLISDKTEEGWNIAFIGTEIDTQTAINKYNVDASNTITHDNTSEGFTKVMQETQTAMSNYSASASRGLDVSKGFFKQVKQ